MTKPVPVADILSEPFWAAAREHRLVVQRCQACARYYLPPVPFCTRCRSTQLEFEPVSGRGRVNSFTVTWTGARQAAFEAMTPYIVGFVELDEQEGLYMYTNLPGSDPHDVTVGAPVQVEFETYGDGVVIPQFRVVAGGDQAS